MVKREFQGDPLDMSWQSIKDRPYKGKGETVYATDPDPSGEMSVEGDPNIPEDVGNEDIIQVINKVLELSQHSEDADPHDVFMHSEFTEREMWCYQVGMHLGVEGVMDEIRDVFGMNINGESVDNGGRKSE